MATIFISGGARGIGLEIARLYAEQNDRVILGLRDPGAAADVPFTVEAVPFDAADDASAEALGTRFVDQTIDVLIANAGIYDGNLTFTSLPTPTLREVLEVNTLGPLKTVNALLPALKRSTSAKIVLISSSMGSMADSSANAIAYRASKAAANKLFQGLATELAPQGIAVLVLHPGWVRTDMGGAGADISPEESGAGIKARIDALTVGMGNRFIAYNGRELPW